MAKNTNYSPTFPMYPGGAIEVTPSDDDNLTYPSVLWVGTAGSVKVTTAQGDVVTFTGVVGGTILPVQVIRVWSAGTSSLNIVAIY